MRIVPALTTSAALAVVGFAAARSLAQEPPAPAPQPSGPGTGSEVEVLRTRGVSTWRNHVWSIERTRLEQSVSELERARELGAGRLGATQTYVLAFGHLVLGNEEPGRAAAQVVRATAPDFVPLRLLDAFEAILAGDATHALVLLDGYVDAIERSPPDPEFGTEFRFLAYLHRGAQRYDMGMAQEAVVDLRTAARIAREAGRVPSNVLLLRLARAHQTLDEHGAAEELVREMLRRDPGNPELYFNLGLLDGTQKHLPEARAWYERTVRRRRSHRDAHGKLAFLAWRDAEVDPAALPRVRAHLAAYESLTERDPSTVALADSASGVGSYWLAVARHRLDQGDEAGARPAFERALRHFRDAIDREPGCVRALNSIIQIGAQLGWPDGDLAPYRERMNAILQGEEGAPGSVRSSFC